MARAPGVANNVRWGYERRTHIIKKLPEFDLMIC